MGALSQLYPACLPAVRSYPGTSSKTSPVSTFMTLISPVLMSYTCRTGSATRLAQVYPQSGQAATFR